MYDIFCVTNRLLCATDFLLQIEKIASCRPDGIILREKDLPEDEYKSLAIDVIKICGKYGVPCILHSFVNVALALKSERIHLTMPALRGIQNGQKKRFKQIGVSCHSLEEAVEAESLDCSYITAGHIFATDCKRDLAPRGTQFLKNVSSRVSVPVYAIGGINSANAGIAAASGAQGVCIMSGLMTCKNPAEYFKNLRNAEGKNVIQP